MPAVPTDEASLAATRPVRSHEENRERAYIAASRRSDRSLDARYQSAQNASKIHERRTGRALRITMQDVIAEEMYEEDDNYRSTQCRRLEGQFDSRSFGEQLRLADYLSHQVAMGTSLGQAITDSSRQFRHPTNLALLRQASWPGPTAQITPSGTYDQLRETYGSRPSYQHSADQLSVIPSKTSLSNEEPLLYTQESLPVKTEPQEPSHHGRPCASEAISFVQPYTSERFTGVPKRSLSAFPRYRPAINIVQRQENTAPSPPDDIINRRGADFDLDSPAAEDTRTKIARMSAPPESLRSSSATTSPALTHSGSGFSTDSSYADQSLGRNKRKQQCLYFPEGNGPPTRGSTHSSYDRPTKNSAAGSSNDDSDQYSALQEDGDALYWSPVSTYDFELYGDDFGNQPANVNAKEMVHPKANYGNDGWTDFIDQTQWH